jgi:hypothetical protein
MSNASDKDFRKMHAGQTDFAGISKAGLNFRVQKQMQHTSFTHFTAALPAAVLFDLASLNCSGEKRIEILCLYKRNISQHTCQSVTQKKLIEVLDCNSFTLARNEKNRLKIVKIGTRLHHR